MYHSIDINQHWCACVDAVRTWLQDTTEYFALPLLDGEKNDDIMPYGLYTGKVSGSAGP